jgi:hypothetical protein
VHVKIHLTGLDVAAVKGDLKMDEHTKKLIRSAKHAGDILYQANTIFPFTLIPDTITIDREKLSISYRAFIKVASVSSTPLNDIEAIDANVGPFFGSLRITSRFFVNNTRVIKFLTREDTTNIQSILQGYKLAKEKEIDFLEVDKDDLVRALMELGKEPQA